MDKQRKLNELPCYDMSIAKRTKYEPESVTDVKVTKECPEQFLNKDIWGEILSYLPKEEQWKIRPTCKITHFLCWEQKQELNIRISKDGLDMMYNFWIWLQETLSIPNANITRINVYISIDVFEHIKDVINKRKKINRNSDTPIDVFHWKMVSELMIDPFPIVIFPLDMEMEDTGYFCISKHFYTQIFKNIIYMASKLRPDKIDRSTYQVVIAYDYMKFDCQVTPFKIHLPEGCDVIKGSIDQKWGYFGNCSREWILKKCMRCEFDDINSHLDAVLDKFKEVLVEKLAPTNDKIALEVVISHIETSNFPSLVYAALARYVTEVWRHGDIKTLKRAKQLCVMILETTPEKFPVDYIERLTAAVYHHPDAETVELNVDDILDDDCVVVEIVE